MRQTVGLRFEQRMQSVEARRRAGHSVDIADGRLDPPAEIRRPIDQVREPLPRDFLFTTALDSALGIAIGRGREILESGEDAEVLTKIGIVLGPGCSCIGDDAPEHPE